MYGNISLYHQYCSPGAGCNVHKTYFLKLTKNILFYLLRSKKLNIYIYIYIYTYIYINKIYTYVTHTID